MSYALTESSAGAELQKVSAEELIEEMANGLHAMAQPLTILRGALWTLSLKDNSPENSRYLDLSNHELERLCDLMTGMQKLFDAHQSAAACSEFDVCEVVTTVAGNLYSSIQQSRQTLVPEKPEKPIYVIGDQARTEYALHIATKISSATSPEGDTIKLLILPRDGHVALTVRNMSSKGKQVGSFERFLLSLTKISIESQNGSYVYAPDPFSVTLTLPSQSAISPGVAATQAASLSEPQRE
jgi:signal transduction histidine kinase